MINILSNQAPFVTFWLIYATFFSNINGIYSVYNLQNNRISLILFNVIQGMTLFLSAILREYP